MKIYIQSSMNSDFYWDGWYYGCNKQHPDYGGCQYYKSKSPKFNNDGHGSVRPISKQDYDQAYYNYKRVSEGY